MQLTYRLDSTTIEMTEAEVTQHQSVIQKARKSEQRKGRKVTVLIRLEVHEASEKQIESAPRGRLFPRPVCTMGALVPELIADMLRSYAKSREQPLSDITRVLWTEFLIARKRGDRNDRWSKFIESKLNEIQSLREAKKKISYARTRQVRVKTTKKKMRATKKTSKPKRRRSSRLR